MPAHTDHPVHEAHSSIAATGLLDAYVPSGAQPWNARRVAHLYRRLGYGATHDMIEQGLLMAPSDLVDQLLDTAAALPPPAPPVWANWTTADYEINGVGKVEEHRRELRHRWMADMLGEGVRAKAAFFWHNHFVTKLFTVGCNAYTWSYYELLHRMAFGNFRELVLEMGKNPAMLVFLNGNLNVAGEPNENYARELMELFTMGEGNGYTQLDVVEMARALTGWTASFNDCTPPAFDPTRFDNNSKTIFGDTANFDFTSAHYHIFTKRGVEVSKFIAKKIYRHFVHRTPVPEVIDGLAQTLRDNDWELMPLFKQLFKSAHFFDDGYRNTKLKSPVEAIIPILKMGGALYPDHIEEIWWEDITYWLNNLGQEILSPPNVAGWPEHSAWINESTLTARWKFCGQAAQFLTQNEELKDILRTIAKNLTNNSNDADVVTAALVDYFLGQDLEPLYHQAAIDYFKEGIPQGYFTNGNWSLDSDQAPYQIVNLFQYLVTLPEFQLT